MIDSISKSNNVAIFNDLVRGIDREGAYIEDLLYFVNKSDFFDAPATAKLIRSYKGGLCEHAIARYNTLVSLCKTFNITQYTDTTLRIVGLLADFGKINYFERTVKNKKKYHDQGKKYDDMGNFDWVAEEGWSVKEASDRFVYGTLGQNAERIISVYIPLSDEEASAIVNLHADYENPNLNVTAVYQAYKLVVLLTVADKIASFVTIDDVSDVF